MVSTFIFMLLCWVIFETVMAIRIVFDISLVSYRVARIRRSVVR